MKTLKLNVIALIAFLAIGITSCSKDDNTTPVTPSPTSDTTITGLAVATPNLSILVQALTRAGLADDLQAPGQLTAFAPTNDAFNAFFTSLGPNVNVNNVDLPTLTKVLLNHVVSGEYKSAVIPASIYVSTLSPFNSTANSPKISMFVQKIGINVFINGGTNNSGVKVSTPDVDASNGVIHIVNKVIAIPNIVEQAIANPNFTSLVAALTRAGNTTDFAAILGGTSSSPFTVFAPTNDAFTGALTDLNFVNLAAIPEPKLDKILKYHVIAGANVLAATLPSALTAQNTYLGQTFEIGTTGGAKIKDKLGRIALIIATDVQCSNGVIHVLDKVLVPTL
jgi:uncharacterized surface protein with fasciclin (FAS1) repeats